MKYKVGICQFEPRLLNPEANLDNMDRLLFKKEADLIVLPELATSGYLFSSRDEAEKCSERAYSGNTAQMFKKLARQNNTSYVVGIAESDGDDLYNSSILINPDGSIYLYRKTHLFYEEKLWFKPGNTGFNIYPAKGNVMVGMMICFDWIFPESARTLSLKGAEILVHPANLVLPWCQQAMLTRSLENRIFSITCNRTGEEVNGDKSLKFTGLSQIISPRGEIIDRLNKTEECIQITEIETEEASDKNVTEYNHLFQDRREEFYYEEKEI